MKHLSTSLILLLFITLHCKAQQDTIYVDVSDSTKIYQHLPTGYSIIDTVEAFANKGTLTTGTVGLTNHPNAGWNKLIPNYPDSLQNKFVHWSFSISRGNSTGIAKFMKDGILLDTLLFNSASSSVHHADTFSTGNFDTLLYRANGTGNDSIEFRIGFFQVRTEIRINLTVDLAEEKTLAESVSLYPNPCENFIQFSNSKSFENKVFKVLNLSGQTVMSGAVLNKKIITTPLSPGLYFLCIPEAQYTARFHKL